MVYWHCYLTIFLAIMIEAHGQAGNWSSGGGEILEHSQNPWFLAVPGRFTNVRYCVMKGDEFPIERSELDDIVKRSIQWWNNEFSNAFYPENKVPTQTGSKTIKINVETARFVKEECSESTDLAFQFGKLTASQRAEFNRLNVDLTRYVALTIRTDYSDMLRGKGFIYVSPDRGPEAFKGENVESEAWTVGGESTVGADGSYRLESVVKHELGHVFGLTHSAQNDSIMSARHAEMMVSKPTVERMHHVYGSSFPVFFPKAGTIGFDLCGIGGYPEARTFFSIPESAYCFRLRLTLNRLDVEISDKESEMQFRRIGSAKFVDGGQRRHQQLVTLWLPKTQKLFPDLSQSVISLLGPAATEVQHSSFYQANGSNQMRPIFVQASPRYAQVGGVTDKGIVPDLLSGTFVSGWGNN